MSLFRTTGIVPNGPRGNMVPDSFKDISRKERIAEIIDRLDSEFEIERSSEDNPFLTLVRTVLSQNTNRKNTRTAFQRLASKFTTPSKLAEADLEDLEDLIRPAGLYRSKSERLKKISSIVLEKYGGSLDEILRKSPDQARKDLLDLPGVGPKTADCVLVFAGARDVLPVDTHVARTSKRLGFADGGDDPEGVKEKLEPLIPDGRREKGHLLLIEHGRNYCKAINPICEKCPIEDLCPKKGLE